jgi:hypothetical protein
MKVRFTDRQYIEAIETSDELEVDDHNVVVSRSDEGGAFVQTWTWVSDETVMENQVHGRKRL